MSNDENTPSIYDLDTGQYLQNYDSFDYNKRGQRPPIENADGLQRRVRGVRNRDVGALGVLGQHQVVGGVADVHDRRRYAGRIGSGIGGVDAVAQSL